eukprot:2558080-Pyramimonas_sp.AAC.1
MALHGCTKTGLPRQTLQTGALGTFNNPHRIRVKKWLIIKNSCLREAGQFKVVASMSRLNKLPPRNQDRKRSSYLDRRCHK